VVTGYKIDGEFLVAGAPLMQLIWS